MPQIQGQYENKMVNRVMTFDLSPSRPQVALVVVCSDVSFYVSSWPNPTCDMDTSWTPTQPLNHVLSRVQPCVPLTDGPKFANSRIRAKTVFR